MKMPVNPGESLQGEVLVVAGEASGDLHAGDLLREIRREAPGLSFFGMGGEALQAAGMEILHDLRHTAVMGLAEVVGHLGQVWKVHREIRRALHRRKPAAVLLVDFPDFNLPLARAAHRQGIPVVYFISPQLWAWRSGRVRAIARDVRKMICILPFEVGFYREHGARAVFVGHPLVDQVTAAPNRAEARRRLGIGEKERVIALLPGSRKQEIRLMLSPMLEAARTLAQDPGYDRALLPLASTLDDEGTPGLARAAGVEVVRQAFLPVLAAADVAMVTSGTSTLAAAMTGTPMVVGYRVHPLTYAIGRRLVRVQDVGLVNLVHGERFVPERIQSDCTAAGLAEEVRRLIEDPTAAAAQNAGFDIVRRRLGPPGVFPRAAEAFIAALIRADRSA